jgi:hypothetical protein
MNSFRKYKNLIALLLVLTAPRFDAEKWQNVAEDHTSWGYWSCRRNNNLRPSP